MRNMRGCLKNYGNKRGGKVRCQVRWDKRDDPEYRALRIFLVNVAMGKFGLVVTVEYLTLISLLFW